MSQTPKPTVTAARVTEPRVTAPTVTAPTATAPTVTARTHLVRLCALCCVVAFSTLLAGAPSRPAGGAGISQEPLVYDDWTAQQATVTTLREIGAALMSWLTDNVSAAAAGSEAWSFRERVSDAKRLTHAEITELLHPNDEFFYMAEVPKVDGWGNPLEFHVNEDNLMSSQGVLAVRSSGRDGRFQFRRYDDRSDGPFNSICFDHDIVWMDGYFVVWPARPTGPETQKPIRSR